MGVNLAVSFYPHHALIELCKDTIYLAGLDKAKL